MSNYPSRKKVTNDDDEVEQLLRAAQDDMLLKLSINSHIASASTIESDLDRRFQALKKPGPHLPLTSASKTVNSLPDDHDLFARFTALKSQGKGKYKSYGRDKTCSIGQWANEAEEESSGTDNGEVDKLIKWAIDAARLDPSPLSGDNLSENDESDVSENDDDDEADGKRGRKRSK